MTTTIGFESGWHLSSKENVSTVVRPAESEVPQPELNVIRATFPRARPRRVAFPTRGSAFWEWLEFGLVVTLALSGFVSIAIFLTGTGGMFPVKMSASSGVRFTGVLHAGTRESLAGSYRLLKTGVG